MAKTREIRGRIRAVTNIQRITKTMQMIATARFQAAQRRATASKPFARYIAQMVGELAQTLAGSGDTPLTHPLLQAPAPSVGKVCFLVLTSNRGLCGGYNANILRTFTATLKQMTSADVEVVGKKGLGYCKFNRIPVAMAHTQFTDRPSYDSVETLAQRYMDLFVQGQYDSIHVLHMGFQSMSRQTPQVVQLLPLRPPTPTSTGTAGIPATPGTAQSKTHESASATTSTLYDFYPGAQALLKELLPITVKTTLFQCFNEAVVSEQIARMVAMKSATDAAKKMKGSLTRKYNRARQTAITTELMEVISGAASVA